MHTTLLVQSSSVAFQLLLYNLTTIFNVLLCRTMYWSSTGNARIEKASMDGANRTTLHNTDLFSPIALTLDISSQTLFWVDRSQSRVESSDVNGGNRRVLSQVGVGDVFGIAVGMKGLYLTDWEYNSLRFLDHMEENETMILRNFSSCERLSGVQVVNEYRQPMGECRDD